MSGGLVSNTRGSQNAQAPNHFRRILVSLRHFLFAEEADELDQIIWVSFITVIIALLTVQMEHFNTEAGQALDRAQQYAVQAMGVKARGEVVAGYAWNDAYRQWLDWESQASLAEQRGDAAAAARYRAVRDRVATLTPLLGADYMADVKQQPNLRGFEADTYLVDATARQERYLRSMNLYDVLSTKSGTISIQIVLLGIALALIALAPSEELIRSAFVRRLPILAALVITVVVVVWVVQVFLEPAPLYAEETVDNYAQGVGLAYQGDQKGAVAAFDKALQSEPDFAGALYRRGNAHFALGDYAAAAADFQAAWDAGKEETNVKWNLGWTDYLMGKPQDAIAATSEALGMAPDQEALQFNLTLMHLAAGDVESAQQAFAAGLAHAAASVTKAKETGEAPPASLWSYLNTALEDFDHFTACLGTKTCKGAPAYETLAVNDAVKKAAADLRLELKNAAVALEYMQALPGEAGKATVGAPEFGTGKYDASGKMTDFVALGSQGAPLRFGLAQDETSTRQTDQSVTLATKTTAPVLVRFPYKDVQDGQQLVMKVYRNGVEAPWLRVVENWKLGAKGEAVLPLAPSTQFALTDGDYRLEIYLDGHLLQEGSFKLGADAATKP